MKTRAVGGIWQRINAALIGALLRVIALAVGANFATGYCSAADTPLKVGINPEYPPLVFRQPEGTNGVEIDFAKALGKELGQPIEFVVLRFDELIPALLDRRIDIIMSGMSITRARQLRVTFSQPYVHNQLRAIFPLKSRASYKTVDDLLNTKSRVGVIAGTTAEVFVKQNCRDAQVVNVLARKDVGFFLLKGNRLDVFVDDTFALADILSQNEAEIGYLKQPLKEEDLAWAVRPGDTELLSKVNAVLEKWKLDGTVEKTLDRWIPYLKSISTEKPTGQPTTAQR